MTTKVELKKALKQLGKDEKKTRRKGDFTQSKEDLYKGVKRIAEGGNSKYPV